MASPAMMSRRFESTPPMACRYSQPMQYGFGVRLQWPAGEVEKLFEAAVSAWSQRLAEVPQ
jgi:hypothetical protein